MTWMAGTQVSVATLVRWTVTPGHDVESWEYATKSQLLLIQPFDLGAFLELVDVVGLGFPNHIGLDLVLDLGELRHRLVALVLHLDDVPAELRLYRIRHLSLVQLECRFGEFRHHLVLAEVAEIA